MDIIKVEKRDTRANVKQLRRAGIVPCCVYGGSLPNALSIQMEQKAADQLIRTKREGSKLRLELNGEIIHVQIKEKVRDYISGKAEHIQFQALRADQRVNSIAHVFLKNTENVPGILEQMLYEVPFSSLPKDMIDTVTIDLEGRPTGTVLTVSDIPEFQSSDIELQIKADSMVLRISDKKRSTAPGAD